MNTLKSNLFILFSATLLSLGVWLSILFTVDPSRSDPIAIFAFFGSLFIWLSGLLTFVFLYLGSIFYLASAKKILLGSMLQATLISFALVFILILKSLNVLGAWEVFIIALLVITLELFIISRGNTSDG